MGLTTGGATTNMRSSLRNMAACAETGAALRPGGIEELARKSAPEKEEDEEEAGSRGGGDSSSVIIVIVLVVLGVRCVEIISAIPGGVDQRH